LPSEALTSPALLSQRERRENNGAQYVVIMVFFPSLPSGREGPGE
jgi:hypothetical protein